MSLCLNRDFSMINKMNRINFGNLENLTNITVQTSPPSALPRRYPSVFGGNRCRLANGKCPFRCAMCDWRCAIVETLRATSLRVRCAPLHRRLQCRMSHIAYRISTTLPSSDWDTGLYYFPFTTPLRPLCVQHFITFY